MMNVETEKALSKFIGVGLFTTIIFIIDGAVTDPVNAPKLFILGLFSTAILFYISTFIRAWLKSEAPMIGFIALLFLVFSISAVIFSNGPLTQNLYGSYGRNNGFLTYVFLLILFLATAMLRNKSGVTFLLLSIVAAGWVNVAYCIWVIAFGDFLSWSNPYGNILGTLGNPNFIGAFLGIFAPLLLAMSLRPDATRLFKISSIICIPLTLFAAVDSQAIQGRVVAASGFAIIGFFYLRSKNTLITAIYTTVVGTVGLLALLGALQKGPFTEFIYKTSVSLRGQYWLAGFNTGKENFWTGVGFDTFGDWYRRERDAHALVLPGPNTVVNTAHNIPMDIFAFGGLPLFISYALLIIMVVISVVKIIRRGKAFDPIFTSLLVVWVGYQLQSIISINQIGLAIIGWVFGGALIAYEKMTAHQSMEKSSLSKNNKAKLNTNLIISPKLLAGIGGVIGALIAVPPLSVDMAWRDAQVSRTVDKLEKILTPSYLYPQNTMMYAMSIDAFEQSNLNDLAVKYNREALKFNQDSFDLWRLMYLIKNSTPEEKEGALANMKRLDPLNPDVAN
jgi:hypothetical protein